MFTLLMINTGDQMFDGEIRDAIVIFKRVLTGDFTTDELCYFDYYGKWANTGLMRAENIRDNAPMLNMSEIIKPDFRHHWKDISNTIEAAVREKIKATAGSSSEPNVWSLFRDVDEKTLRIVLRMIYTFLRLQVQFEQFLKDNGRAGQPLDTSFTYLVHLLLFASGLYKDDDRPYTDIYLKQIKADYKIKVITLPDIRHNHERRPHFNVRWSLVH